MAPDLEKDLLGQFLGVLAVAAVAVGQAEHLVLVPPHQFGEGRLAARRRQGEQFLVGLYRLSVFKIFSMMLNRSIITNSAEKGAKCGKIAPCSKKSWKSRT